MEYASPGLCSHVLSTIFLTSSWRDPHEYILKLIANQLTDTDAKMLPAAMGQVLGVFKGDRDRMSTLALMGLELSYYEMVPDLVRIGKEKDYTQILTQASSLANNPAVPQVHKDELYKIFTAGPELDKHLLLARLDDSYQMPVGRFTPEDLRIDPEYFYWMHRPGLRTELRRHPTTPAVVFDSTSHHGDVLNLSIELMENGISLYRFDPKFEIPLWFGVETLLVGKEEVFARVHERYPFFTKERHISTEQDFPTLDDIQITLRETGIRHE